MADSPSCFLQNNCLIFASLCLAGIFHGTFTRRGGISPAPWDSLNVSFELGDSERNIRTNRETIKKTFKINRLLSAKQVHGSEVQVITEQPATDLEFDGYDALITNVTDIGLMVQHADCQAVLLYDPLARAVAIIHVGWRGSVVNIIRVTIETMTRTFGSCPANLLAAISPSLGPCCAEFIHYRMELPVTLHSYQVKANYFDFWSISCDQLCRAGVLAENITVAKQCTVCNDDYFSYRRDKNTGRCASIIGLYG